MQSKYGKIKAFKFQFDILLEKVELAITFPCQISVTWKRGNQKIETKNKVNLDNSTFLALFNERLSMLSNLYFEETKNLFLEKKSTFTIAITTTKGNKIAGVVNIDLASYINNKITEKVERLRLEKCPDKNAKLHFLLRTTYIGEVKDFDLMSQNTSKIEEEDEYEVNNPSNPNLHDNNHKGSTEVPLSSPEVKEKQDRRSSETKEKLTPDKKNSDDIKENIENSSPVIKKHTSEMKEKASINMKEKTSIIEPQDLQEKAMLLQKISEKNDELKKNLILIEKLEKSQKTYHEELEKHKCLESNIKEYQDKLENINSENELLKEKVLLSENEQKVLQQEIKNLHSKIRDQETNFKNIIEKEKAMSLKHEENMNMLEKNLQEKNEKIESMKKQMNQTTIIIEKNESEYHEKIQNSKKEFELKILELQGAKTNFQEQNQLLLEKTNILEGKIADLSKVLDQKNLEENSMKSGLEVQTSNLSQENSEIKSKLFILNEKLKEKEQKIDEMDQKVNDLKEHLKEKEQENEQLIENLKYQLHEKSIKFTEQKTQIELLQKEKTSQETKYQDIINKLETNLKEYEEKLRITKISNENSQGLEDELFQSQAKIKSLQEELQTAQENELASAKILQENQENYKKLEKEILVKTEEMLIEKQELHEKLKLSRDELEQSNEKFAELMDQTKTQFHLKYEELNIILTQTKEELLRLTQQNQDISQGNGEIDFFKSQLVEKEKNLHELQEKIIANEQIQQKISNENLEKSKEIEDLSKKIEDNLKNFESEIERISNEKSKIIIELKEELNLNKETFDKEIERLNNEKNINISEINNLKQKNSEISSTILTQKNDDFTVSEQKETQINLLNLDLQEKNEQIQLSTEEINKLNKKILEFTEEVNFLQKTHEEKIEELLQKEEFLVKECEKLKQENFNKENQNQNLEQEKNNLVDKINDLTEKNMKTEYLLSDKTNEFEALNNKYELQIIDLEESLTKIQVLSEEMSRYQTSLENKNVEFLTINEKFKLTTDSLKAKEKELSLALEQKKENDVHIGNLEKSNAELSGEISTLHYQLELRECEKNNLEIQLNTMLKDYEKLLIISRDKLLSNDVHKEDFEFHEKQLKKFKHSEIEKRGSVGEISNLIYNENSEFLKDIDSKPTHGMNEEDVIKMKQELQLKEEVLLNKTEELHTLQTMYKKETQALKEEINKLKGFEEFKDKFHNMEKKYNSLEKDFITAKYNWAQNDQDSDKLKIEQRKSATLNNKLKELEVNVSQLENELLKSKQKLGDAINAAQEFGGSELVDKIASAIMNINFQ